MESNSPSCKESLISNADILVSKMFSSESSKHDIRKARDNMIQTLFINDIDF